MNNYSQNRFLIISIFISLTLHGVILIKYKVFHINFFDNDKSITINFEFKRAEKVKNDVPEGKKAAKINNLNFQNNNSHKNKIFKKPDLVKKHKEIIKKKIKNNIQKTVAFIPDKQIEVKKSSVQKIDDVKIDKQGLASNNHINKDFTEESNKVVKQDVSLLQDKKNYKNEQKFFDSNKYFNYVLNYIRDNLPYPYLARKRGIEGSVKVKIWINEAGKVVKVELLQSSGFKLLDKNTKYFLTKLTLKEKPPYEVNFTLTLEYKLL
ncbi:energy transducer TonB [Deferribacter desulfuricans]|uniref:energy transducer TonB n=1 Tax=Deferribacter desulfuricans TaxID=197162 RepID=UPI00030F949F|nr:energy transducer TonB [Deferribacter desulfuricans]